MCLICMHQAVKSEEFPCYFPSSSSSNTQDPDTLTFQILIKDSWGSPLNRTDYGREKYYERTSRETFIYRSCNIYVWDMWDIHDYISIKVELIYAS